MAYIAEQLSLFDEPEETGITDADIDRAILSGSGFEKGKIRIFQFFQMHTGVKERADFLKNEYGVGGMYPVCKCDSGVEIGIDHSASGVRLYAFGHEDRYQVDLGWNQVANVVDGLISRGEYLMHSDFY